MQLFTLPTSGTSMTAVLVVADFLAPVVLRFGDAVLLGFYPDEHVPEFE